MSNLNPIVALAHSFAARGQRVDERVDSLVLLGVFADSTEQAAALALSQKPTAPFLSVQVYDPEISGDLGADETFDPERQLTVTIVKPTADHVVAFVSLAGAASQLEAADPAPLLLCAELEARAAFQSRGLMVERWDLDHPFPSPSVPVSISPRKLVRDYVPGGEVAHDLSPWIETRAPAVTSKIYDVWRRKAARRLLGGLVNATLLDDQRIWLQANGPPLFRIEAADPTIETGLGELTEAVEWVFLAGHDVDVRHLIFAVELARACRPGIPFEDGVSQARAAAATTYEAHVQSASRETLKALADLRKTVVDETQKVTQRAQDLTSGLWKDVAVAAAPFVVKILGDAAKLPSQSVAASFYFAAAVFVAVSFALQVRINSIHLSNQREARSKWFDTLYAYVSPKERAAIAETPVKKAEDGYSETLIYVALVYAALLAILVWFGVAALRQKPADIDSPPPASAPVTPSPTATPKPPPTAQPSSPPAKTPRAGPSDA